MSVFSLGAARAGLRLWSALVIASTVMAPSAPAVLAAGSSVDPAASLSAEQCPAGAESVLPVSSSVDSDGWIRMTYDIDGTQAYREAPPKGFDPRQATDALLARHNIPTRPKSAADLSNWKTDMASYGRVRTKNMCRQQGARAGSAQRYSTNWGGDEMRSLNT